jgi:hypothetical protein
MQWCDGLSCAEHSLGLLHVFGGVVFEGNPLLPTTTKAKAVPINRDQGTGNMEGEWGEGAGGGVKKGEGTHRGR